MLGIRSEGRTSEYVVLRSDAEDIRAGVLLLFPYSDRDAVQVVKDCGLIEWGRELDKHWEEIDGGQR